MRASFTSEKPAYVRSEIARDRQLIGSEKHVVDLRLLSLDEGLCGFAAARDSVERTGDLRLRTGNDINLGYLNRRQEVDHLIDFLDRHCSASVEAASRHRCSLAPVHDEVLDLFAIKAVQHVVERRHLPGDGGSRRTHAVL